MIAFSDAIAECKANHVNHLGREFLGLFSPTEVTNDSHSWSKGIDDSNQKLEIWTMVEFL